MTLRNLAFLYAFVIFSIGCTPTSIKRIGETNHSQTPIERLLIIGEQQAATRFVFGPSGSVKMGFFDPSLEFFSSLEQVLPAELAQSGVGSQVWLAAKKGKQRAPTEEFPYVMTVRAKPSLPVAQQESLSKQVFELKLFRMPGEVRVWDAEATVKFEGFPLHDVAADFSKQLVQALRADRMIRQRNAQEAGQNEVLKERLLNAQITKTQLSNGAVMTQARFAGSLQPNYDLSCISMGDVSSEFNPPALMHAAKKCVLQEDYAKAWALMTTANGFAYYDLKRLADRSTQGARSVLTMRVLGELSPEQNAKAQKKADEIQRDPAQVQAYCAELTRIGPPTYDPQWAILHGIGAYQEPRNGHYLVNVDTKALWQEVLKNRCTPLNS